MEVSPNSTTQPLNMYDYLNSYFMNPIVFTALVLIIIIFTLASVYLGKNSSQNTNTSTNASFESSGVQIYGIIAAALFILLIIANGLQYFFGVNFYASIKNLFFGTPEVDIKVIPEQNLQNVGASFLNQNQNQNHSSSLSQQDSSTDQPQVFNIPGNYYGYHDAKALCKAYGGRLAKYDEIESAYNDGAEWCNYGWSYGQMALYPTQKTTYNNLQKIKGHKHDCGRPGINGGYIANPGVKFGVNCYGVKPKINQEEQHLMDVTTPYPKTKQDLEFEQSVSYWKNKLDDILVSPFNYTSWNKS